jgi:catechol 2,3-dioxygenase-like lactoylglutathione lyase family enzyme
MLADSPVVAILAVSDLDRAKEFYGGTLGLPETPASEPDGVYYTCGGGSRMLVYESGYAGTNRATAAGWQVDDIAAAVADLQAKGVSFEEYDNIPGVTRDGAIHRTETIAGAWFKDPDGNILAINGRS